MKKSVKNYYLGPIILVLFLFPFISPVLATESGHYETIINDQTSYVDKYYEIDKDGRWEMDIYLGDQKIATVDDTGTTTFPLTDHLGSPTVITNQSGTIVEANDYDALGNVIYSTSTIKNIDKFTGKPLDDENNLQYYGARYLDNQSARFVSIDPFSLRLNELGDQQFYAFLADPQRLNSYAYTSNNPLNNIDADGNLTIKALAHPGATVAQLGFWYGGINAYLKPNKLYASAALLERSLSWRPNDINITTVNQNSFGNIIDQIKQSSEYQNFVSKQVEAFEKENRNTFSIHDIRGNKSLEFVKGDLNLAIGRIKISQFSGQRDKNGKWTIATQFNDTYDFDQKLSGQDYDNDWFKTSANNSAYLSQQMGVISNYNIEIKFNDEIKF